MKNFLAIFTGSAASMGAFMQLDDATRMQKTRDGVQAWHAWVERHQAAIVEKGAPAGKTKRVTNDGIVDIRNNISAYTVVQAESHDAAAAMFLNHPHFAIFPGDGVEIMECMPIPQMPQ